MPKFRKKPVVVEARQTGRDYDEDCAIMDWCNGWGNPIGEGVLFHIDTLEGPLIVSPGDWIICGVQGEFYPVKPDIFALTYERVPDDPYASPFSHMQYFDDPVQRRALGTFSED